jgi:hypothetical protein
LISNASPLILFAKINEIDLLLNVFEELIIHEEVYNEIVKGKEFDSPDAFIIENLVNEGKIKLSNLSEDGKEIYKNIIKRYRSLDAGEAATIALVLQRRENRVLIDESMARKVSRLMGLKPIGSLGVALTAYKKGIVDEKKLREVIRKMVSTDFRVSAAVIEKFWTLLERMKKCR